MRRILSVIGFSCVIVSAATAGCDSVSITTVDGSRIEFSFGGSGQIDDATAVKRLRALIERAKAQTSDANIQSALHGFGRGLQVSNGAVNLYNAITTVHDTPFMIGPGGSIGPQFQIQGNHWTADQDWHASIRWYDPEATPEWTTLHIPLGPPLYPPGSLSDPLLPAFLPMAPLYGLINQIPQTVSGGSVMVAYPTTTNTSGYFYSY